MLPEEDIEEVEEGSPSPEELTAVLDNVEPVPRNLSVVKGIKYQTIKDFVRYLKDNCAGEAHADLTVSLNSMTYEELDKMAEEFLNPKEPEQTWASHPRHDPYGLAR
jgi:hypothetical protein